MQKTRVRSLGQQDSLEEEMATHSSILAWRIPWMEEPCWLQSTGSQRVGHNWATSLSLWHYQEADLFLFPELEACEIPHEVTTFGSRDERSKSLHQFCRVSYASPFLNWMLQHTGSTHYCLLCSAHTVMPKELSTSQF